MRVEIPNQITVTIGGLISRGVKAVEVTDAGKLVFTLTDGSVIDLGSVMGPQGPKGETGATGPQGQTGPQGAKGETGAQGPKGETGSQGPRGETGPQGEQGPKGDTGATGAEGPKGATGDTGPKGEPGEKGEKGEQGEQGPKGDKGETGPQGKTGPQGPAGPTGPKGDTGTGFTVKGYYGSVSALQASVKNPEVGDAYGVGAAAPYDIYIYDGVTNAWVNNGPLQGAKGDKGDQGEQGPKGEPGDTGPAGASGADGITPSIGENGNWYLGTTDTGKPSRGAKGDTGAPGAKGDQGAQGPKGETGATGAEGPAGKTPVKGTDYFTDADKAEIAQAAADLVDMPSASTTTPKAPGMASAGEESEYARGDHVHPSDPTKQGVNDEIQAMRLRGGINSIGSMAASVAINPAVNGAGFARLAGATVKIYYDDYEMPISDSEIDKLFDGRLGTYINFPQPSGDFVWQSTKTYPAGAYVTDQTHIKWYKALKENTNVSPIDDTTETWEFVSRAQSGTYANRINLDNVTIYIDITFLSSIRYENTLSLYWRTTGQNAPYVKVEKYDSNAGWFQVYEKSNIGSNEIINNIYIAQDPSGDGGAQRRLRITIKPRTGTNWFALSQIAITGLYGGIEGTLVSRGGSTMYGDLSPYAAGGASLGGVGNPWKEIRGQYFYGDLANAFVKFSLASTREYLTTGETLTKAFGKIQKWFADLGTLAFKSTVAKSNLASDVQKSLGKADTAVNVSVTTADNGKFLRVVNGVWAASEISNANGGSF